PRRFDVGHSESDVDAAGRLDELLEATLLVRGETGIHAANGADISRLDRARISLHRRSDVSRIGRCWNGDRGLLLHDRTRRLGHWRGRQWILTQSGGWRLRYK